MLELQKKVPVLDVSATGKVPDNISEYREPVVLRGLVKHWKLVELGQSSTGKTIDYLKSFYNGKPAFVYHGGKDLNGQYAYNDDATALNYETKRASLDEVLEQLRQQLNVAEPESFYIASNVIDFNFPGLREDNDISIPVPEGEHPTEAPIPGIWIGNRSTARCHYDASDNIACCVVGKRRFYLFPPNQIANLYPGPLAPTPGGQAITMVDFHNPDLQQYPNFEQAMAVGMMADMEPGDGIYIPAMWWHQVEGLSKFNVLINYWWSAAPRFMGAAMNVLYHAMLSLRDKPEHEKAAWKQVFDYYIFDNSGQAREHLPEQAHGFLAPMDDMLSRQLRAMLLNKLNR